MNYKVGDIIEGQVIDFGNNGEGIVKIGAFPIFVPFAIKGETIKLKLNYVKKDYAFGDIIETLSTSNLRIKPKCPYFGKCGGCDMQHISMDGQLEIKRQNVQNIIKKNAGIDVEINTPVHVKDFEYRNKIALPFGYNKNSKRVCLGFYSKKSHDVVPMKWCPLHGEWAATLIKIVTEWANEFSVSVYDEKTKKGLLRHLVARFVTTMSIVFVINGNSIPHIDKLSSKLEEEFKNVAIYISHNFDETNVIFGDDCKLIYGREVKQNLGAYSAVVSPLSFLQVNNDIKDLIYDEVCYYLNGFDGDIVELYSGVGLLTAQIAKRLDSSNIISVEIVPSAVENAKTLMEELNLSNRVECICDDACNFLDKINTSKQKALVLDPPRKGCSKEVLDGAIKSSFEQIIYISCNPATLARDINILKDNYEIKLIKLFDMFPQTSHVETVVKLQSK